MSGSSPASRAFKSLSLVQITKSKSIPSNCCEIQSANQLHVNRLNERFMLGAFLHNFYEYCCNRRIIASFHLFGGGGLGATHWLKLCHFISNFSHFMLTSDRRALARTRLFAIGKYPRFGGAEEVPITKYASLPRLCCNDAAATGGRFRLLSRWKLPTIYATQQCHSVPSLWASTGYGLFLLIYMLMSNCNADIARRT